MLPNSAQGGCELAMARLGGWNEGDESTAWLEKAAQSEPEAMRELSRKLDKKGEGEDKSRARRLMLEAALLGLHNAQFMYALQYCAKGSLEQFQWMRRSAMQSPYSVKLVQAFSVEELNRYVGGGSGRIVFEIGAALGSHAAWPWDGGEIAMIAAGQRAIELHPSGAAVQKVE